MNWPDPSSALLIADGRHASALDRPETQDRLRETIAARVDEGLAIYPRGGGTAMALGGSPSTPGVLLDTTALTQVIDYPAADMTITIEAGATLAALQSLLAEQGQRLPLEAPDPDRATLGGIFATNTCGSRRFGLGRPRDQIIGVRFATSRGEIVHGGGRVVKNVAGYDFPKLLTGSLGTLGVISQMTFKVRPRPESSALALIPYDRLEDLKAMVDALNTSGTRPVALDVLNRPASSWALGPAAPDGSPWMLVVGFEDTVPAVRWSIDQLRRELGSHSTRLAVVEGADAEPLWAGLTAFQAAEPGPLTIRAGLTPSRVADYLQRFDPQRWAVQAHAGNGILHGQALGATELADLAPEIDELRGATGRLGGYLIVPRCPTSWKERLRVWGEPRPDWTLQDRVKRALDPKGLMNPGRFVGTI